VGQDAVFLDAFCRAYALGLAKSPDREGVIAFRELLDAAADELRLHNGYAARWGVDLHQAADPATSAYTDFLLAVAALEPVGHIAAAMTPCMRLYAYLGQQLAGHTKPESPCRDGVETYSSGEFEALARRLEVLLDRYGDDHDRLAVPYHRQPGVRHPRRHTAAVGVQTELRHPLRRTAPRRQRRPDGHRATARPADVRRHDLNQRWVLDMGLPGPDAGKGGTHVICGPGFTGDIPDGFYAGTATTNRVLIMLRALPHGDDMEGAIEAMKSVKVCPLTSAGEAIEPRWTP
jgi:thiaminase (transcriptional activator TenA)